MHFCDFSCLLDKLLKKESILRHPPISINLLFEYETKPESKKPFGNIIMNNQFTTLKITPI